MGAWYKIKYVASSDFKREIEDLLKEITSAVSVKDPGSVISHFNDSGMLEIPLAKNGEPVDPLHKHFFAILEEAYEIYRLSDGHFDPTIGHLNDAWSEDGTRPDSTLIDSLRNLSGMQHVLVRPTRDTIHISTQGIKLKLDFTGLASGYIVDRIFELFTEQGVNDLAVYVGGTSDRTRGTYQEEAIIELTIPAEGTTGEFKQKMKSPDRAMGNSSKPAGRTINPKTGYLAVNNIVSANIIHHRCISANGLANACLAMDIDAAIMMIEKIQSADALFIYRDQQGNLTTFTTERLKKDLLNE